MSKRRISPARVVVSVFLGGLAFGVAIAADAKLGQAEAALGFEASSMQTYSVGNVSFGCGPGTSECKPCDTISCPGKAVEQTRPSAVQKTDGVQKSDTLRQAADTARKR